MQSVLMGGRGGGMLSGRLRERRINLLNFSLTGRFGCGAHGQGMLNCYPCVAGGRSSDSGGRGRLWEGPERGRVRQRNTEKERLHCALAPSGRDRRIFLPVHDKNL